MKFFAVPILCAVAITALPIFGSEGRATLETARADIDPALGNMLPVAKADLAARRAMLTLAK